MISRRLLLLALVLALAGGAARAGNKNAGTSGAQFLKIGAGARPAAMGEAFTALADDVNAVAWNPAGLGRLDAPQFTATHSQWFQASQYAFLAAAYPFSWGTVGVSLQSLTVDQIDKRSGDTAAADSTFDSMDNAYALSYGVDLGERWAAGVTVRSIRQKIDTESASAVAADAGALWKTPHAPLTVGVAVRHMGSEVKFVDEGDPLPMTVNVGLGYRLLSDRLRLGLDARKPRDNDVRIGAGGEVSQALMWEMSGSLRAGYNSAGADPTEGLTGVTAGLGLSWRNLSFDMAWVPYGNLGNTFRYSFLVKF